MKELGTDWLQFLTLIATMAGLFIWARTEASADRRAAAQLLSDDRQVAHQDRRDITTLIEANRKDMTALIEAIRQDVRDFHTRLCEIESKKKK